MPYSDGRSTAERTSNLSPVQRDRLGQVEREKLLIAISDAGRLGFDATRSALVDILKCHEGGRE